MSRDYELGFILSPEVNEEQTRTLLERVEQIVNINGGQVVRVNQWGRRRLAYPIEHHRDGFYVFIDMILTPESVSELDRTLKVSEEILRHLIIRRDPKVAQKERDARATAAAQAQAQAQAAPATEVEVPAEQAISPENEPVVVSEAEEEETPVAAHTDEEIPVSAPVAEEETVEA